MSASLLEQPVVSTNDEFGDLFDQYVADHSLPPPEWLTRLQLEKPRRNIHCLSESTRRWKRVLDIVSAATLLVLLAPVMAIVAIAVRLTSRGPIIFRQTRVGLNLRQKKHDRR